MLLECESELCKIVNQAYEQYKDVKPVMADVLRRTVLTLRKYGLSLTAKDVADELGLAFRTYYRYLETLGLTYFIVVNAVKQEAEEIKKKKIERREVKRLPPRSYDEFLEREVVKEVAKKLTVANIGEGQKTKILRTWFKLSQELELTPEDFYGDGEVKRKITEWLSNKIEQGYDKDALISILQSLQKWLETPILPTVIEQSEYKGEYTTAEIPKAIRDKIVLDLLEKGDELSLTTIKALMFLYYTGSRAESLTNFTVEQKIKLDNPDILRAYGEDSFIVVRTLEKGKKGKKIEWRKLIPLSYEPLLPPKLTRSDLDKIRRVLRNELIKYENELNDDTKRYIREAQKSLHLMRHTSAREYLRAFKFNRYLVAKLLGWQKESNLQIYGDYGLFELLKVSAEEHKIEFVSPHIKQKLLTLFQK